MNVSVRDLKNGLSEYLHRVRAGERLVVTDRGRPIAEVLPLGESKVSAKERLLRLSEAGELSLPRGRGLPDVKPMRVKGKPVSRTLLEDRG